MPLEQLREKMPFNHKGEFIRSEPTTSLQIRNQINPTTTRPGSRVRITSSDDRRSGQTLRQEQAQSSGDTAKGLLLVVMTIAALLGMSWIVMTFGHWILIGLGLWVLRSIQNIFR